MWAVGAQGACGNSETRSIKSLINSKPPVVTAMPDPCVPLGRFRAEMLSACVLSAEKSSEGLGSPST